MLHKLIEILISITVLIPTFCVLNRFRFHNTQRALLYFLLATYLSAVYLFVGMPTLQFMRFELSLSLVPFLPMIDDLRNTILNIIMFIPLGLLLPFLCKRYSAFRATLLFGFGMSLSIELLQILTYRATDINDIIANTFGAVLGYLVFKLLSRFFPAMTKFASNQNEIPATIITVVAVMFFIQPFLASLYYKIT